MPSTSTWTARRLGQFVGAAEYGGERLDVASQLGQPRFGLSGYQLQVELASASTRSTSTRAGGAPRSPANGRPPPRWASLPSPTARPPRPVANRSCLGPVHGRQMARASTAKRRVAYMSGHRHRRSMCAGSGGSTARARGQPNRSSGANSANGPCTQYDASNRAVAYGTITGRPSICAPKAPGR